MRYQSLYPSVNIGVMALENALSCMRAAKCYTIYAGKYAYIDAVTIQRALTAQSIGNPFAPVINVVYDDSLESQEWFVTNDDEAVGAKGV